MMQESSDGITKGTRGTFGAPVPHMLQQAEQEALFDT